MNNYLGVEKILEHLKKHSDCYVIIGGIATRINLEERGFRSRETKDFDIVLLADGSKKEFAEDIVKLLKNGKYQNGFSNEKRVCYRFVKPISSGYPKIIELFSLEHNKNFEHYLEKISITIDDEELSAIVLNEEVFEFIKGRKTLSEDGLSIVDTLGLIVLKSHAYFKNLTLYKNGIIQSKNDYLKHRNDVIRLLTSLNGSEQPIKLPPSLSNDCKDFVEVLRQSSNALKQVTNLDIDINTLINVYVKLLSL